MRWYERLYSFFLFFLGSSNISYILYVRLFRERLQRELTLLSDYQFYLYSYLAFIFFIMFLFSLRYSFVVYKSFWSKSWSKKHGLHQTSMYIKNKYLRWLTDFLKKINLLDKSLNVVDETIEKYLGPFITKYILIPFVEKTDDFFMDNSFQKYLQKVFWIYFLFDLLPRIFFLLFFIFDVFYFHKFFLIYRFAWLPLIPRIFKFFIHILKKATISTIACFFEERFIFVMYFCEKPMVEPFKYFISKIELIVFIKYFSIPLTNAEKDILFWRIPSFFPDVNKEEEKENLDEFQVWANIRQTLKLSDLVKLKYGTFFRLLSFFLYFLLWSFIVLSHTSLF